MAVPTHPNMQSQFDISNHKGFIWFRLYNEFQEATNKLYTSEITVVNDLSKSKWASCPSFQDALILRWKASLCILLQK